jgi:hypothetical protein
MPRLLDESPPRNIMKNVLLISLQYYPHNTPCSHRIHSFARHLPKYGFRPTILCMNWNRAAYVGIPYFEEWYDPDLEGRDVCRTERLVCPHPHRMCALFRSNLMPFCWPPEFARRLLKRAAELHREENYDVVLATSPARLPLGVASRLARATGIPWVADFRDISDEISVRYSNEFFRRARRYLNQHHWAIHLEKKICRTASAVVTVSSPLAEVLRKRCRRDVRVVLNGYEPSDFADIPVERPTVFTMVYAGTVTPARNPAPLFDALDILLTHNRISARDFRLYFYGKSTLALASQVRGRPCEDIIACCGRLARNRTLALLKNSTVVLQLAHANDSGIFTSKVFEYLGARRPILSIPHDRGVVDALLCETRAGVSATTPNEIADIVAEYYREWRTHGQVRYDASSTAIARYTRDEQTSRLACVLDQASSESDLGGRFL